MEKLGQVPEPKKGSQAAANPKMPPISPEDAQFVKDHLSTDLGKLLLATLEPISRRDLHPNNLNISFDPMLKAIDIHVVFVDTNTPLWSNLQRVMWRHRMTWRFDATGPQLMLVLRWFLPYEFSNIAASGAGKELSGSTSVKPADQGTTEPPKLEVVKPSFPNIGDSPTSLETPNSGEVGVQKESVPDG